MEDDNLTADGQYKVNYLIFFITTAFYYLKLIYYEIFGKNTGISVTSDKIASATPIPLRQQVTVGIQLRINFHNSLDSTKSQGA